MDKQKGTIQLLQQHTDVWHIGQATIDLRMTRKMFTKIQKFIPECYVVIEDVEAYVQAAEAQMFPARVQEQEVWAQSVLESVLKTKVKERSPIQATSAVYLVNTVCMIRGLASCPC